MRQIIMILAALIFTGCVQYRAEVSCPDNACIDTSLSDWLRSDTGYAEPS